MEQGSLKPRVYWTLAVMLAAAIVMLVTLTALTQRWWPGPRWASAAFGLATMAVGVVSIYARHFVYHRTRAWHRWVPGLVGISLGVVVVVHALLT